MQLLKTYYPFGITRNRRKLFGIDFDFSILLLSRRNRNIWYLLYISLAFAHLSNNCTRLYFPFTFYALLKFLRCINSNWLPLTIRFTGRQPCYHRLPLTFSTINKQMKKTLREHQTPTATLTRSPVTPQHIWKS